MRFGSDAFYAGSYPLQPGTFYDEEGGGGGGKKKEGEGDEGDKGGKGPGADDKPEFDEKQQKWVNTREAEFKRQAIEAREETERLVKDALKRGGQSAEETKRLNGQLETIRAEKLKEQEDADRRFERTVGAKDEEIRTLKDEVKTSTKREKDGEVDRTIQALAVRARAYSPEEIGELFAKYVFWDKAVDPDTKKVGDKPVMHFKAPVVDSDGKVTEKIFIGKDAASAWFKAMLEVKASDGKTPRWGHHFSSKPIRGSGEHSGDGNDFTPPGSYSRDGIKQMTYEEYAKEEDKIDAAAEGGHIRG